MYARNFINRTFHRLFIYMKKCPIDREISSIISFLCFRWCEGLRLRSLACVWYHWRKKKKQRMLFKFMWRGDTSAWIEFAQIYVESLFIFNAITRISRWKAKVKVPNLSWLVQKAFTYLIEQQIYWLLWYRNLRKR